MQAVGTYPAVVPDMVLYYHFNNNSAIGENATEVVDSSGKGNNATVNDSVFSVDGGFLYDGVFIYNGIGSQINVGNPAILNFTNKNFTINLLVKLSKDLSGKKVLNKRSTNTGILIQTGSLYYSLSVGNGTLLKELKTNGISLNRWNMISVVYNANTTNLTFFMNSKLQNSTLINYLDYNGNLLIGSDNYGYFNGSIDELIIYNRTLSELELYLIYKNYSKFNTIDKAQEIIKQQVNNFSFEYNRSAILPNKFNYLEFNGINSYLESRFNLENNQSIMVEFDINLKDNLDGTKIFDFRNGNEGFLIQTNKQTTYQQINYCYGNSSAFNCKDSNPLYNGVWNKVLVSLNSNRVFNFFNDVSDAPYYDNYLKGSFLHSSFWNLWVGTNFITYFNGSLKNIKIYNESYSPSQLSKYYFDKNNHGNYTQISILMYHQINDSTFLRDPSIRVSTDNFSEQMAFLNSSGYSVITDIEYLNWSKNQGFIMPSRAIILTFDDGWLDNLINASVIMASYGYRGVIALSSRRIGITPNETFLNWSQVNELITIYNWTIASHGLSHCNMATDISCNTTESLSNIFSTSKNEIIGNTSYTPLSFIYPGNKWTNLSQSVCSNYYSLCFGSSYQVYNPKFNNNLTNLTNGELIRIGIKNYTTIEEFIYLLNYTDIGSFAEPIFISNLQEGYGSLSEDLSGYNNNFSLNNVEWKNNIDDLNIVFENIANVSSTVFFYNSTNLLAYSENFSIYNSHNINLNDGQINITIQAKNLSYILNNYNLTEGYSRDNDPVFNGTYLNNTLTDEITVDTYGITKFSNGVLTGSYDSNSIKIGRDDYAEV